MSEGLAAVFEGKFIIDEWGNYIATHGGGLSIDLDRVQELTGRTLDLPHETTVQVIALIIPEESV